jgi:hypothetical protein
MIENNPAYRVGNIGRGPGPARRPALFALAIVAALGGGLLADVAPAAAALPGLEVVSATIPATNSQSQSVTVSCPAGTKLISAAGFITGGFGSVAMDEIYPDAVNDSVQVTAKETDPYGGNWHPTAVATCSPPIPGLTWVSQVSPANAADKSATATCPANTKLVGTGGSLRNGFGEVVITSIAPQNGGAGVPADSVTVAAN